MCETVHWPHYRHARQQRQGQAICTGQQRQGQAIYTAQEEIYKQVLQAQWRKCRQWQSSFLAVWQLVEQVACALV